MLKENGLDPVIIPPEVDETIPTGLKPHMAVMFLALKKALYAENTAIRNDNSERDILIAADTIVVYRGRIIGKPETPEIAFKTLKKLCGAKHRVFTGVAILKPGTGYRKVFYEISDVFFKTYSDDEINAYISTAEPYDKAGGYAVQGVWGKYIDRIEGDVDNVIGLPWSRIKKEIKLSYTAKAPYYTSSRPRL